MLPARNKMCSSVYLIKLRWRGISEKNANINTKLFYIPHFITIRQWESDQNQGIKLGLWGQN